MQWSHEYLDKRYTFPMLKGTWAESERGLENRFTTAVLSTNHLSESEITAKKKNPKKRGADYPSENNIYYRGGFLWVHMNGLSL